MKHHGSHQLQPSVCSFAHFRSLLFLLTSAGMAPGCLIGGFIMQKYGRKFAQYFLCFPATLGWLAIFLSNSVSMLLFGRFLTGKQAEKNDVKCCFVNLTFWFVHKLFPLMRTCRISYRIARTACERLYWRDKVINWGVGSAKELIKRNLGKGWSLKSKFAAFVVCWDLKKLYSSMLQKYWAEKY